MADASDGGRGGSGDEDGEDDELLREWSKRVVRCVGDVGAGLFLSSLLGWLVGFCGCWLRVLMWDWGKRLVRVRAVGAAGWWYC